MEKQPFAACASQYSWTTVVENPPNVKEIWSGHGIQAQTSISLTLKSNSIYALVISYKRIAATLTFVKTMAVFSDVCHIFTLYSLATDPIFKILFLLMKGHKS